MSLTIGIDPGLSGAIAVLNEGGDVERVADLPVIRDGRLSWIDGQGLQGFLIETLYGRHAAVFVERVTAMPKQGIASAFNFGVGFGSILSVLQARHLPINLVTPGVWKAAFALGGKAKGPTAAKHAALDKARLLFPTAELSLCKHEGRAEALLLARWGWERHGHREVA